MRDTWIDDHTGDETVARPDFKAELRAELAKELAAPAGRQAPSTRTAWRAIGWASVAAAAAVAGVVVLNGGDDRNTVVPGSTPDVTAPDASTPPTTPVPVAEELVIPAVGGNPLQPTIIATLDFPADLGFPRVALLPDRIVVLQPPSTVLSFDRDGNALPDTTIETYVWENTGGVLGGHDGTLYVVENSDTDNSQTVKAFQLVGGVWQVIDSTIVVDNNDGVYAVTGDGLVLGGTIVLPAPTPDSSAPDTGWVFGEDGSQVFRNDGDGTSTTWNIVEQFENLSIPAATDPFGDGVLFLGNSSGTDRQRYIGILRPDGGSEFFRPGTWFLSGVDDDTALFMQVADGVVTLGVLASAARSQIDWAAGTVLGVPLGLSSVDKVLTGINPVLGEPTADSGWFVVESIAPGDEDCLAGQELRVLHWDDLTVAFKKGFTSDGLEGELMWSWVVGDLRGSGFDSFREPFGAPASTSTGLRTEDGFGLGTTVDELKAAGEVTLSDFIHADGSRGGFFTPQDGTQAGLYQGFVIDADGTVIGFGVTQSFC